MINQIISLGILISVLIMVIAIGLKIYIFVILRKMSLKTPIDLYNLFWEAASIGKFKAISKNEERFSKVVNILLKVVILVAIITVTLALFTTFKHNK